jgi:uncharacterized DUF497 family protein
MTTWNERKRRINLAKHGVDLALAEHFDWDDAIIHEDDSEAFGEQREIATGWIGAILYVYVYTLRDDEDHAISLRKARPAEARRYAREFRSSHRR